MTNPQFEYAYHWLRDTALYLQRPNHLARNRRHVTEIDTGRPGFASQLRLVALEALGSEGSLLVHKAIAALAVVGTIEDLPHLELVAAAHRNVVRTAIFEIEHSSPAG